jgi:uncharacterized protein YegP (UPF0339 family)
MMFHINKGATGYNLYSFRYLKNNSKIIAVSSNESAYYFVTFIDKFFK